jgi:hypothetical protein
MAQTKLFSPEGFHFMVTKDKGFYLMKDPVGGYKKHTSKVDRAVSSKFVLIDYSPKHGKVADSFHYTSLTKANTYKPKTSKASKVIGTSKPQPPTSKVTTTKVVSSRSTGKY